MARIREAKKAERGIGAEEPNHAGSKANTKCCLLSWGCLPCALKNAGPCRENAVWPHSEHIREQTNGCLKIPAFSYFFSAWLCIVILISLVMCQMYILYYNVSAMSDVHPHFHPVECHNILYLMLGPKSNLSLQPFAAVLPAGMSLKENPDLWPSRLEIETLPTELHCHLMPYPGCKCSRGLESTHYSNKTHARKSKAYFYSGFVLPVVFNAVHLKCL